MARLRSIRTSLSNYEPKRVEENTYARPQVMDAKTISTLRRMPLRKVNLSRVPVLAESLSSVAGPWAIELPVEKYEHEARESTPSTSPVQRMRNGTLAARDYFPAVAQIRPLSLRVE